MIATAPRRRDRGPPVVRSGSVWRNMRIGGSRPRFAHPGDRRAARNERSRVAEDRDGWRYNVAPTQLVAAVRAAGRREARALRLRWLVGVLATAGGRGAGRDVRGRHHGGERVGGIVSR